MFCWWKKLKWEDIPMYLRFKCNRYISKWENFPRNFIRKCLLAWTMTNDICTHLKRLISFSICFHSVFFQSLCHERHVQNMSLEFLAPNEIVHDNFFALIFNRTRKISNTRYHFFFALNYGFFFYVQRSNMI